MLESGPHRVEGVAAVSSMSAAQLKRCTQCGAPLTSRFCGDCGAPAESGAQTVGEGWRAIASDLFPEERNGFFSVLMAFARHPVRTIIRLTEDPRYRSHWSFLAACLGAQLTITYLVAPRLLALMFGTPQTTGTPSVLTSELVQYIGIFVLLPVQYYLCRALGTIHRTPRSYAKLCALSVGYSAALSLALFIVFFGTMTAVAKFNMPLDYVTLGAATSAVNVLAVITFVSWTHRIFWGMKWPVAIAATLVIAALSWAVVYPGLGMLMQQSGTVKMLDSLFS